MSASEREQALRLQQRGLRDWIAMLGSSSAGAELFERDGVTAAIVPACAERSIANSVTFTDAGALLGMLGELRARYAEAGIEAWTVWTPEFETGVIAELEAAGHEFDGKPQAMTLELERWRRPGDAGELDWSADCEPALAAEINDLAYGLDPRTGFGRALASPPAEYRLYRANVEGEPACVLATIEHEGGDLGFYFVATHPDYRGRGLCSRLMAEVLEDARQRGLRTSSLQASPMGEPVYERLGFRAHFRMQLHERREMAGSPANP